MKSERKHAVVIGGQNRGHARFFKRSKAIVAVPWSLATGGDLQWKGVEGRRTVASKIINKYVERVIVAAGTDKKVADRLLRVMHLLTPPEALFAPHVVASALRAKVEQAGHLAQTGEHVVGGERLPS